MSGVGGYEVALRTVEARPTAVVAASTTWAELPTTWPGLLDEVWAFLRQGTVAKVGHNVFLYKDDVPNVEIGVQVAGPFDRKGRVVPSATPAGQVATTVHRGSYAGLSVAHDAVHEWCRANGRRMVGSRWEVYGDWTDDESKLETEVFWLLED
jgi:effector-binding domain-containing protein